MILGKLCARLRRSQSRAHNIALCCLYQIKAEELPVSASQIIREIFARYEAHGQRQYGEDVTELQHALQCAHLAQCAGEPAHMVAACLLHDYGHLLHDSGEDLAEQGVDARHEELGANHLAQIFIPEIVEPIRLHVAAKRYLCWRQPQYFDGLSATSQRSLQLQGGAMSEAEAAAFVRHRYGEAAVWLRRYDDAAKRKDFVVPNLETYRTLLAAFVRV
jgi:phosphonate degradation associated HDIG domain protein